MRRIFPFALLLAACARPVLYFPTLASAGITSVPSDASAPAPHPAPAERTSSPSLALVAGLSSEEYLMSRHIVVPVAGADMRHVEDSFHEPRDGDRVHRAIDILAPRGTPILSADDGVILRMSTSSLGGITMYTVDRNEQLVYYYAHMERYNDQMFPGRAIMRGDTLGFVGTTGNAPKNVPHLHFQVMRWPADGRYWDGEAINPFEALGGVTIVPTAHGRGPER